MRDPQKLSLNNLKNMVQELSKKTSSANNNASSEELLGYLRGTLTPVQRRRVDESLRKDKELRSLFRKLEKADRPMRRTSLVLGTTAVTAALVVASVWLVIFTNHRQKVDLAEKALFRGDFAQADQRLIDLTSTPEGWSPRESALRSKSKATNLHLVSPRGLCLPVKPDLRFIASLEAGPFVVTLRDQTDVVVLEHRGREHFVPWTDTTPGLIRGQSYSLVIEDLSGRSRTNTTIFTVSGLSTEKRIRSILEESCDGISSLPLRHFVRARLLARERVFGDASEEIRSLLTHIPEEKRTDLEAFLILNDAPELALSLKPLP